MMNRRRIEYFNATVQGIEFSFTNGRYLVGWLVLKSVTTGGIVRFGGIYLNDDNMAYKFVSGILEAVGVYTTEQLERKTVKVAKADQHVIAIGACNTKETDYDEFHDRWLFKVKNEYQLVNETAEKFLSQHRDLY